MAGVSIAALASPVAHKDPGAAWRCQDLHVAPLFGLLILPLQDLASSLEQHLPNPPACIRSTASGRHFGCRALYLVALVFAEPNLQGRLHRLCLRWPTSPRCLRCCTHNRPALYPQKRLASTLDTHLFWGYNVVTMNGMAQENTRPASGCSRQRAKIRTAEAAQSLRSVATLRLAGEIPHALPELSL